LQAYVDESGVARDSAFFVVAGFLASHQEWARFTDDWDAALKEPPRVEYFKAAEAEALR
jgi:hypothetical protein